MPVARICHTGAGGFELDAPAAGRILPWQIIHDAQKCRTCESTHLACCFAVAVLQTDVDCGGPCQRKCGLQQRCLTGADCASETCSAVSSTCICPPGQTLNPDKRKCIAASQLPGIVKDVTPEVGAPLPACAAIGARCRVGEACRAAADCASRLCDAVSKKCACPADFVPTANGLRCVVAEKVKNVVTGAVNTKDPCWNGVRDGFETDVDW